MAERRRTATLEDIQIPKFLRRFAGKADQYNREGDRNFGVFIPPEVATEMIEDGWAIKQFDAREEGDDPQDWIKVKVNFRGPRPPRVVMISSRGRTTLGEDEIAILDWANIEHADLIISPYEWEVNGKTGISAYLQTLFVTIEEDDLERKYADVPESTSGGVVFVPQEED